MMYISRALSKYETLKMLTAGFYIFKQDHRVSSFNQTEINSSLLAQADQVFTDHLLLHRYNICPNTCF